MLNRILLIFLYICVASGLIWKSSSITFDNYEWLESSNPSPQAKDYLNSEFQPGEDLIVGVELNESYFNPDLLKELHSITEELKRSRDILDVDTPLNATIIINAKTSLETESYKEALDNKHLSIESYEDHLEKSHYFGQLISKDFTDISIIINGNIDPRAFNYFKRERIIEKTQDILNNSTHFQRYHLSGELQLSHQMDVQTKNNLAWLWLSISLVFLFLLFVFRNIYKILIIGAATLTTVLSSIVVIALRGHPDCYQSHDSHSHYCYFYCRLYPYFNAMGHFRKINCRS